MCICMCIVSLSHYIVSRMRSNYEDLFTFVIWNLVWCLGRGEGRSSKPKPLCHVINKHFILFPTTLKTRTRDLPLYTLKPASLSAGDSRNFELLLSASTDAICFLSLHFDPPYEPLGLYLPMYGALRIKARALDKTTAFERGRRKGDTESDINGRRAT